MTAKKMSWNMSWRNDTRKHTLAISQIVNQRRIMEKMTTLMMRKSSLVALQMTVNKNSELEKLVLL
jgi:hypothetical protein